LGIAFCVYAMLVLQLGPFCAEAEYKYNSWGILNLLCSILTFTLQSRQCTYESITEARSRTYFAMEKHLLNVCL